MGYIPARSLAQLGMRGRAGIDKTGFSRLKATFVESKQPIAVILGMYRSGTSLAANFVHALGVDSIFSRLEIYEYSICKFFG